MIAPLHGISHGRRHGTVMGSSKAMWLVCLYDRGDFVDGPGMRKLKGVADFGPGVAGTCCRSASASNRKVLRFEFRLLAALDIIRLVASGPAVDELRAQVRCTSLRSPPSCRDVVVRWAPDGRHTVALSKCEFCI